MNKNRIAGCRNCGSFFLLMILLSLWLADASCNPIEKQKTVAVIFDTDMAADYDDVGALALLHTFADQGDAEILATCSSNSYITTGPVLSVINTYFNRPAIPIGVIKSSKPCDTSTRGWSEFIIKKYPHSLKSNNDAMDAIQLYRKILSGQPDTSVTIITVGYLSNLSNLLNSPPDSFSSLEGINLVHKKVKRLVAMAAGVDSNGTGYEWNVMRDIPASKNVFNRWPTPITLSGLEIGFRIFTGMKLINNANISESPVKDAYRIAINYDGTVNGRYSWDQTAVLAAVKGPSPWFDFRKLDIVIKDDGKDSVVAGNRITYLIEKESPETVAGIIEKLMMHVPVNR